ncbi:MAG: EAL domain-containing protein [Candidatus Accumulibacter sp.]|nr:EAL domain-containing protein [Accumulibacter sp.]
MLTPSGDHYISHPFSVQRSLRKFNLADRPYFQQATKTQELTISDSFIGADGIPAIAIDLPVIDNNGEILLHLGGVLHLSRISPLLTASQIAPFEVGMVVDRRGRPLAASQPQRLLREVEEPLASHPHYKRLLLADKQSTHAERSVEVLRFAEPNGTEWIGFDTELASGWHLFLFRRLQSLHDEIAPTVSVIALTAAASLLLPCILALVIAWRYSRRWQKAEQALAESNATLVQHDADHVSELQKSELRQRIFFESTAYAVVLLNNGRIVDCNQAALDIFGATSREQLLSLTIADLSPPTQANGQLSKEDVKRCVEDALSGKNHTFEWLHQRLDNRQPLVTEVVLSALRYDDQTLLLGTIRNIGERKRTENELREREAMFRNVFQLSPIPAAILAIDDSRFMLVNDAFTQTFGWSVGELLASNSLATGMWLDAAQRQQWLDSLQRSRATYDFPAQLFNRHGELRELLLNSSLIDYAEQKCVLTLLYDVTERNRADEALHIASMVYQTSHEAMMVTDATNLIISVNPAFERITGYEAKEIIGKNPRFLGSDRQDRAFYRAMWHELERSGRWQGEIWNVRKNGEVYPEYLSINTIYHPDGSVYRRIALFTDISKSKEADDLIWKQFNFDMLTGLPNRNMFHDRLDQEIRKADRSTHQLALLLIDLDNFKEVNEALGHNMGDRLLVEAAARINNSVRDTDTVARFGGDEFNVLLSNLHDVDGVERVATSILDHLSQPFDLAGEMVHLSASIGVAFYPSDASTLDDLLKNADQAMYQAKNLGRNRYSYFTAALQEAALKRLRLISDLRGAVTGEQLRVYFQPIVELATGSIHKAEALVRWQHPQRGLVSPGEFIPLAEETGLIVDIGNWVFRESARWAKHWRTTCHTNFQISVNKSPAQFDKESNHANWLEHMFQIGLSGQGIVIEITEGLLLTQKTSIVDSLAAYRQGGIQVALDDFGTGYSSLAYLKKFQIDYIKIDQSFTRNLSPGSRDMALSEAIIAMSHKLGLRVIAEGVETTEQRDLLLAAGCDYAQGYLFARPMPPEEFETLLAPLPADLPAA